MNLRALTEEHILKCAEYCVQWREQAAMWAECGVPLYEQDARKQAEIVSRSAFRWASAQFRREETA